MPKKGKAIEKAESKYHNIFQIVLDTLRKYVFDREKTHTLSNGFLEKLDFLENVGFLKELETSYPDVEIIKEIKDGKIRRVQLKGRGDNFYNACAKCDDVVRRMAESSEKLEPEDPHLYQMVATNACIEHLNNMMKSEGIQATVCFIICFKQTI